MIADDTAPNRHTLRALTEEHLPTGDAATSSHYVRIWHAAVRLIFLSLFRVRVSGMENVPGEAGIVCANHMGWTDPFLVLLFFPRNRRVYVVGDENVKDISSFRRRVIDSLEIMIMLDRSKPLHALRAMENMLKRGGSVLIFPEGNLGTKEGELQELQQGAAHTSVCTGAPLIPVGVTGTSRLWLGRHLHMRVGPPIYPDRFEGATRERVREMNAELSIAMRALLPGDPERPRIRLLERWLTKLL